MSLGYGTLSDAPPSQTTPTAQAKPAAQVELVATPTNTEALPPKPNGKAKVSEIATDCGNNRKKSTSWDHFEKIKISRVNLRPFAIIAKKLIVLIIRGMVLLIY